jgi:type II secretory pathway component PulM
MKNKFQQFLQSMKDQEWYQQIQNTYQQLSPEQQSYVKWGGILGGFVVAFYFTWSIMQSSNTIKEEYFEKQGLVQSLNQASEEIRRLKGQSSGFSQSSTANWRTTLQNLVVAQGLQPDAVELLRESAGISQNVIQETLLEVQVKGITVRPLVQLLFQMEHAQPPMKLKGINVESGASEGLLNAKLNLSGYLAKGEKSK